ncbi:MAG TPA: DUF268 domain-containing protein [Thermoanaerobaculia bacterium]|jgi:SAM-dependent methyltransferase
MKNLARFAYRWVAQVWDPFRSARAVRSMPAYIGDYLRYRMRPGAEPLHLRDLEPALHEKTGSHEFDTHYFFLNAWAARRILATNPVRHIDVASQTALATQISAVIRVTYLDYRPLNVHLSNLQPLSGNLTSLPFRDASVRSLSCLHVAEHVGLGRYGDPIDPRGTIRAADELRRVLAPGGNLFFALPIGRPRVCFNAHRVHAATQIRDYFEGLELVEYSAVGDDGLFHERVPLEQFDRDSYACGMFWFRRSA